MVDIATLGFRVDTKDLKKAEDDLQDVARASGQAEAAAESYGRDSSRAYRQASSAAAAASAATKGLTVSTRQLQFAQRNLSFQLVDVAQGFALGQAPLQILLQQGFQIAQVFGPGSGGVAAILGQTARQVGALAVRFAPLVAVVTGATAAVSAYAKSLSEASGEQVTFGNVVLAVFQTLAQRIGGFFGPILEGLGRAFETVGQVIIGTVTQVINAALRSVEFLINSAIAALNQLPGFLGGGSFAEVDLGTVEGAFKSFFDEVAKNAVKNAATTVAAVDSIKIATTNLGTATQATKEVSAQAYGQLASVANSALSTMFGESKSFSIASALINTYQGITQALANYPPPFSYAMAAAQGALGFAQVNAIRSTSQNSSGGGTSVPSAPSVAPSPEAAEPSRAFNLTLVGDNFSRAQIEELAAGLGDFIGDGGTINTGTA